MIGIVDYGSGNVGAISNILNRLKVPHIVSSNHRLLSSADRFILAGVGAFDSTMRSLVSFGLINFLNDHVIGHGKKILGVCVGMQIFGDSSEEGELPGLGWIPGCVVRINSGALSGSLKLPHMGWNSVNVCSLEGNRIFSGVDPLRGFYFLHSYYFSASCSENVAATVKYGLDLPCALVKKNIIGCQFHPEKSHRNGAAIFNNFAVL